jgi:hypothetical protein
MPLSPQYFNGLKKESDVELKVVERNKVKFSITPANRLHPKTPLLALVEHLEEKHAARC